MLAPVDEAILLTVDGIRAGAVPDMLPSGGSFQRNLIRLPTTQNVPGHHAPRVSGFRVAIGDPEMVRGEGPLSIRTGKDKSDEGEGWFWC
jgi:hypothetical protein